MRDLSELMPTATAPELDPIMAYKGVYALCTTDKSGHMLKATHYASVLVGGSQPIWAVWRTSGRFQRFFSYRSEIEAAYPKLVWRRKMATWQLYDLTDKSIETRRAELETIYGKGVPVHEAVE